MSERVIVFTPREANRYRERYHRVCDTEHVVAGDGLIIPVADIDAVLDQRAQTITAENEQLKGDLRVAVSFLNDLTDLLDQFVPVREFIAKIRFPKPKKNIMETPTPTDPTAVSEITRGLAMFLRHRNIYRVPETIDVTGKSTPDHIKKGVYGETRFDCDNAKNLNVYLDGIKQDAVEVDVKGGWARCQDRCMGALYIINNQIKESIRFGEVTLEFMDPVAEKVTTIADPAATVEKVVGTESTTVAATAKPETIAKNTDAKIMVTDCLARICQFESWMRSYNFLRSPLGEQQESTSLDGIRILVHGLDVAVQLEKGGRIITATELPNSEHTDNIELYQTIVKALPILGNLLVSNHHAIMKDQANALDVYDGWFKENRLLENVPKIKESQWPTT